jgi:hypothetical protein
MRVGERGQIERRVAGRPVGGQGACIHVRWRRGQVGAARQDYGHGGKVSGDGAWLKFNLAHAPGCTHNKDLHRESTASINEVTGWRWLLLWLLAALLRLWGRTLRFTADAATQERLAKSDVPVALVIWHNRLFVSAEYFRRYRTRRSVYALVSASKDGAWLAAFYRLIGIQPVRGSSSNFGREAGRALIEVMRDGHDIGITPDGPRGPMYLVDPGVLVVAPLPCPEGPDRGGVRPGVAAQKLGPLLCSPAVLPGHFALHDSAFHD